MLSALLQRALLLIWKSIIQRNIETERIEVDRQFAKLRKQLRDQEDRISELESSNARLKASCTTADAASQTDPTPTQEHEVCCFGHQEGCQLQHLEQQS
jgi:cell shape-determining protein MreC